MSLSKEQIQAQLAHSPFIAFLNMELSEVDAEKQRIVIRTPMRPELERPRGGGQFLRSCDGRPHEATAGRGSEGARRNSAESGRSPEAREPPIRRLATRLGGVKADARLNDGKRWRPSTNGADSAWPRPPFDQRRLDERFKSL